MTKLIELIISQAPIEEIELDLANNAHIDNYINQQDEVGRTALDHACKYNSTSAIKLLLAHPKIDVNIASYSGHTALHRAVLYGSLQAVKLLIANPKIDVTKTHRWGHTALDLAKKYEYQEIIQLLESASNYLMFNGKKYKLVEEN